MSFTGHLSRGWSQEPCLHLPAGKMSPCPDTVPTDAGLARLPCICVVSVVGVPFKDQGASGGLSLGCLGWGQKMWAGC